MKPGLWHARITTSPNEKDIIAPAGLVSVQIVEGQLQLARQAPNVLVIRVDQFTAPFTGLIFVERISQRVTAPAEPGRCFVDGRVYSCLAQTISAGQPGKSTADDCDNRSILAARENSRAPQERNTGDSQHGTPQEFAAVEFAHFPLMPDVLDWPGTLLRFFGD